MGVSGCSILTLEVWAVQNILVRLERLYDGCPGGNEKSNKHNCTDHHIFNPPKKCIEDCSATVVNGFWISGSNVIILGSCDIFAARLNLQCAKPPREICVLCLRLSSRMVAETC